MDDKNSEHRELLGRIREIRATFPQQPDRPARKAYPPRHRRSPAVATWRRVGWTTAYLLSVMTWIAVVLLITWAVR
jgi:hypothetical protein